MSNLHLLTERMYNFSTETIFLDDIVSETEKQECFDNIKNQIEFLWLSAYDTAGKKLWRCDIIGDRDKQNIIDSKNIYKMYPSSADFAARVKIKQPNM